MITVEIKVSIRIIFSSGFFCPRGEFDKTSKIRKKKRTKALRRVILWMFATAKKAPSPANKRKMKLGIRSLRTAT